MLGEDGSIGFIGAGNMAEAIVRGLLRAGKPAGSILASDVRSERLELFAALGVTVFRSNLHVATRAEVLVLAVKPQVLSEVLSELAGELDEETLLVSIAAGVPTPHIEAAFERPVRVVRVMPNMPLLVGAGVSAIVAGRHARAEDMALAADIFAASGKVVRLTDERLLDAVTAVSGSGPAYVFYLAEAMHEAALAEGLAADVADLLVRETINGAGQLLRRQPEIPAAELRWRVTSPGGTTQAAIAVLEAAGARELLVRAVRRAAERARELGAG